MTVTAGRAARLSDSVVEALTARIVAGDIRPGEKLPTESALMEQLGVSRTVAREAVSRLQAVGLVETYRGKGSFVLTRPSAETFSADPARLRTSADVSELLEFRLGVEPEASALAARRHSPGQLAEIAGWLARFSAAAAAPSRALEADFEFHRSIAAATGNGYYIDLVASLGPTMVAMPPTRLAADDQGHAAAYDRVVIEHETIHAAIARGDSETARAAMRVHLTNSQARVGASRD